jgi:hypothetical protein
LLERHFPEVVGLRWWLLANLLAVREEVTWGGGITPSSRDWFGAMWLGTNGELYYLGTTPNGGRQGTPEP